LHAQRKTPRNPKAYGIQMDAGVGNILLPTNIQNVSPFFIEDDMPLQKG